MKKIPLTKGKFALVDDEDFIHLSRFSWCALKGSRTWYATRFERTKRKNKCVYMHREILGISGKFDTDHRDGNGLNNQRANLRACTRQQNLQNKMCTNPTGYKGVWLDKRKLSTPWQSGITQHYKKIHLGRFETAIEAAQAYNQAALKLFGQFARLNQI